MMCPIFYVDVSRRRVGIYLINDPLDAHPDRNIGKHLNNASVIGKGRLLKYGKVLHYSIVNDIFNNLIDEINLVCVKTDVIQIIGKRRLSRRHIKSNDLAHKLAEWLFTVFCFIVLFTTNLTPQNTLKRLNIFRAQRNVAL